MYGWITSRSGGVEGVEIDALHVLVVEGDLVVGVEVAGQGRQAEGREQ